MRNLRNNKGFTLIELMIVVVIIGILAAIAIPKFQSVSKNAKQAEAAPILKQICTLAATHQQENGTNAANLGALAAAGWTDPSARIPASLMLNDLSPSAASKGIAHPVYEVSSAAPSWNS